ncbi:calcium-binding protein [Pseudidiomarina sediminum]|uniref:Calcium-binding protein n=1 Tax=Pseudidiomarina sediminum TaxID=431675 RepID=A0A432Z3X4_9GAMM|nr:excalibur calcium-binding domain-containing protein [Pseudidiomarina sediminum]MBY6062802.1 excalibur calcium-binding domain-containing protein [Pseudidiomarina sediminum]RUO72602.1 calcium-binding protein [Pseudidiomarina sediminum]
MKKWILLAILALAAWNYSLNQEAEERGEERGLVKEIVQGVRGAVYKRDPRFRCDGRRYCNEMRSRDEAMFFLTHCPETQLDDDNDGQPCELDFPPPNNP